MTINFNCDISAEKAIEGFFAFSLEMVSLIMMPYFLRKHFFEQIQNLTHLSLERNDFAEMGRGTHTEAVLNETSLNACKMNLNGQIKILTCEPKRNISYLGLKRFTSFHPREIWKESILTALNGRWRDVHSSTFSQIYCPKSHLIIGQASLPSKPIAIVPPLSIINEFC